MINHFLRAIRAINPDIISMKNVRRITKTNHIPNGILLRTDFHILFNLGLIGINKSYKVVISSLLSDIEYESY